MSKNIQKLTGKSFIKAFFNSKKSVKQNFQEKQGGQNE